MIRDVPALGGSADGVPFAGLLDPDSPPNGPDSSTRSVSTSTRSTFGSLTCSGIRRRPRRPCSWGKAVCLER